MPLRLRTHLAVARILPDVVAANDGLAVERRGEDRRRTRKWEVRKRLARRARQGVEAVGLAAFVRRVEEEGTELRAGQRGGLVGDELDQPLFVELRRERAADPIERLVDGAVVGE